MSFIRWIAGFAIALLTAAFAVLNLGPVPLTWSPFHDPLETPLYLVGLCMMGAGFLIGAFTVWISKDPLGFSNRGQRRKIKNLEKELENLHVEGGKQEPDQAFPALEAKKS